MKVRSQRGFTLVELIVVIVIIGILAAVAIPKYLDVTNASKIAACRSNQMNIETAVKFELAVRSATNPAAVPETDMSALVPTYLPVSPTCPIAGSMSYSISPGGEVSCGSGC